MPPLRLLALTRRHPSAILLVTQLLALLLYPFLEVLHAAPVALGTLGIVILAITTGMVRRTPGLVWVSVGIALPAIALLVAQAAWGLPQLRPWSAALEAALPGHRGLAPGGPDGAQALNRLHEVSVTSAGSILATRGR